jgi:cytochrome P450
MNYASKTKDNLIKIVEMKDREITDILSSSLTWGKENDTLKEQQLILFWLLFITAGIGFMF